MERETHWETHKQRHCESHREKHTHRDTHTERDPHTQHELLKEKSVDFAGLILKHPHLDECTMRVTSSKGNPLKEIQNATNSAIESVNDLKKLIKSKIKVK